MSMIAVGGVKKLPVFVADMEELCLLGLDFLVLYAVCVGLRRVQMQVCGKTVLLILKGAAEQGESPMSGSYVKDERLELRCRILREGEMAAARDSPWTPGSTKYGRA